MKVEPEAFLMVSPTRRSFYKLGTVLAALLVCPGPLHGEDGVFRLSTDQVTYFRQEGGSDSSYYEFHPDGQWRHVWVMHLTNVERDHGTWTQESDGFIILKSATDPQLPLTRVFPAHCAQGVTLTWPAQDEDPLTLCEEYAAHVLVPPGAAEAEQAKGHRFLYFPDSIRKELRGETE